MLCKPAQYLLRCDDLCPTIAQDRWRNLVALIAEFQLRPILAVVPENCDPELAQSPADPGFWAGIRRMQAAGATIALHGYRHRCASQGRSLVPLARNSEFAGVDAATQRIWIREGLRILRGHGIHPQVWVAPRHGFDIHTLYALKAEGIEIVSDSLARAPFVREGMTWIPQQLWSPQWKCRGVWTICIHPNTLTDADVEALRNFVRAHHARFTSVERVLGESLLRPLSPSERIDAQFALARIHARSWLNLFRSRSVQSQVRRKNKDAPNLGHPHL